MFSSKASSVMRTVTGFHSIISFLLYCKFVRALHSGCIIVANKCELNFRHCCSFELTLPYFDKNSLNFSSRLLSFVLISLTKFELISASSWMSSSLLIFSYWLWVKTILKFVEIWVKYLENQFENGRSSKWCLLNSVHMDRVHMGRFLLISPEDQWWSNW